MCHQLSNKEADQQGGQHHAQQATGQVVWMHDNGVYCCQRRGPPCSGTAQGVWHAVGLWATWVARSALILLPPSLAQPCASVTAP